MALVGASCANKDANESKAPITKPQITIEGGRLTPEALWAMGRINSVRSDIETGWVAYTVSYYSVAENRSTSWIRICNPYGEVTGDGLQVTDEFVGYEPAWFGSSGWLAFLRGGKLYLRRDKEEIEVQGAEDIEGFLLSPMRDQIILIIQVISREVQKSLSRMRIYSRPPEMDEGDHALLSFIFLLIRFCEEFKFSIT